MFYEAINLNTYNIETAIISKDFNQLEEMCVMLYRSCTLILDGLILKEKQVIIYNHETDAILLAKQYPTVDAVIIVKKNLISAKDINEITDGYYIALKEESDCCIYKVILKQNNIL